MTHMTRDDFGRLLARERTVIADAAPTAHILCDELAQAERLVQDHVVPWPADIHTAFIDHRHGGDLYAAFTREALMAEVASFSRDWWPEIRDRREPPTLSDEEAASNYFQAPAGEYHQNGNEAVT